MNKDPLVFLPVERWSELMNEFKKDWPRSISGYTTLNTQKHILDKGADYGFQPFCPYGDLSNGLVAINTKAKFNEVIVQCPKDDTSALKKALIETKLIDWGKIMEIPFAPKHIKEVLEAIQHEKNFVFKSISCTETFYLKDDAPYFDGTMPSGWSLDLLPMEYAKLVDDKWPHRYPSSLWYFEMLIKAELGYGLFVNKVLVAWCFIKEMGALGHLYTLEEHRRKGYGEVLLKVLSDRLRSSGKHIVAFCVDGNEVARKLYEKLGFSLAETGYWSTIKPKAL